MILIKTIIFFLIFTSCSLVGILIAKTYKNRVNDLLEMKSALNILETKINFTYEPIPEIFKEISESVEINVGNIFLKACTEMKNKTAGNAWTIALDLSETNMKAEDIDILKRLNKLLGKTDAEGQISEIKLIKSFLDKQIEKAIKEQEKNEKLFRTLGILTGFTIVIIFI